MTYRVHRKKGADESAPKTVRVTYQISLTESFDEWVCVEHEGYAGDKAGKWWAERCRLPMPDTAVEAAVLAQCGLLAVPSRVSVKNTPGKTFANEITGCEVGPKPAGPTPCPRCRSTRRVVVRHPDQKFPGQVVCGDCSAHVDWASHDVVAHYGFFGEPGSRCDDGMVPNGTPGGIAFDDFDFDSDGEPVPVPDDADLDGVPF